MNIRPQEYRAESVELPLNVKGFNLYVMIILGIETSCDETSVALLEARTGVLKLKKHVIASQAQLHKKYGGVVPEVAARKHAEVLPVLLDAEIGRAALAHIDLIAVTQGPGLITSLLVGVQAARTLSFATGIPLVGINHLEAHIYANWLTYPTLPRTDKKMFPSLVLIVSGGHTLLVLMRGHGRYELLGQTLDDAAGESFDKVARLLQLGYPGGPAISREAARGNENAIALPRPMADAKNYDFSFSGLKTAVLYYLERKKKISKKEIPDIAASFEQAVVDSLMAKLVRAEKQLKPKSLMLVGGVSANKRLRDMVRYFGDEQKLPVFIPDYEFTGDNAAMIATTGYYRRTEASKTAWKKMEAEARMQFV